MNIKQLREMLSEQMIRLHSGKGDPKQANAIVNAAGKIIATVRLEMEYARLVNEKAQKPRIPFIESQERKRA